MNEKEIADTIQRQLLATMGQAVLWSWGMSGLQYLTIQNCKDLGIKNSIGALKFKVNGHHHKGHVIVSLNGIDTYDVYICSIRNGKITIKNKIEDSHVGEFGTWIDEQIEFIPEYENQQN